MGWIERLFPVVHKRTTSITLEKCKEIAKGCVTRSDLEHKNRNCLNVARKMGWLPLLGLLSPKEARFRAGAGRRKYTDDELIKLAKQYDSVSKFKHDHPKEYAISALRGLLATFTWLKRFDIFNSGDFVYVYEWPETKVAYVGRTIDKCTRHSAHCMEGDSVYDYSKTIGLPIPKPKYLHSVKSVIDGARLEQIEIEHYQHNGWTLLNKMKGGGIGSLGVGMTQTDCMNIAKQFLYIQDLKKNEPSVYAKMLKKDWLKCCTWLQYKKHKNGTYANITEEDGYKIAKQFSTRSELCKKYDALYRKANAEGWLDKWFRKPITINQYTMDNKLVASYVSATAASKSLGKSSATAIVKACNGQFAQAYGYIWKWVNQITTV